MQEYEALMEWRRQRKLKYLKKKKPVPVSLYPPQIPHGLHCDCTVISEVTGCCLSAWTMTWTDSPKYSTLITGWVTLFYKLSFSLWMLLISVCGKGKSPKSYTPTPTPPPPPPPTTTTTTTTTTTAAKDLIMNLKWFWLCIVVNMWK